jgi:hypothetical protein
VIVFLAESVDGKLSRNSSSLGPSCIDEQHAIGFARQDRLDTSTVANDFDAHGEWSAPRTDQARMTC